MEADRRSERSLTFGTLVVAVLAVPALPLLHLCTLWSVRRTLVGVAWIGRHRWPGSGPDPVDVGRAVNAVARRLRLNGTTCLARSELIWLILSITGRQPVIRLGAAVGLGRGTIGHAWVELDDVPVGDPPDIADRHPPFDRPLLEAPTTGRQSRSQ